MLCTEEYVRARFGVRAAQYADFKCLVGDPSDNIPGVRGVGPKIAARLLARFETLEGVLAGAEGEGEWPERAALREFYELIERIFDLPEVKDLLPKGGE